MTIKNKIIAYRKTTPKIFYNRLDPQDPTDQQGRWLKKLEVSKQDYNIKVPLDADVSRSLGDYLLSSIAFSKPYDVDEAIKEAFNKGFYVLSNKQKIQVIVYLMMTDKTVSKAQILINRLNNFNFNDIKIGERSLLETNEQLSLSVIRSFVELGYQLSSSDLRSFLTQHPCSKKLLAYLKTSKQITRQFIIKNELHLDALSKGRVSSLSYFIKNNLLEENDFPDKKRQLFQKIMALDNKTKNYIELMMSQFVYNNSPIENSGIKLTLARLKEEKEIDAFLIESTQEFREFISRLSKKLTKKEKNYKAICRFAGHYVALNIFANEDLQDFIFYDSLGDHFYREPDGNAKKGKFVVDAFPKNINERFEKTGTIYYPRHKRQHDHFSCKAFALDDIRHISQYKGEKFCHRHPENTQKIVPQDHPNCNYLIYKLPEHLERTTQSIQYLRTRYGENEQTYRNQGYNTKDFKDILVKGSKKKRNMRLSRKRDRMGLKNLIWMVSLGTKDKIQEKIRGIRPPFLQKIDV